MRALRLLLPLLALAACDVGEPAEDALTRDGRPSAAGSAVSNGAALSPEQVALLNSRDCGMIARAYLDAIERGDFDFAARFWSDPTIDAASLGVIFLGYERPLIEIADVQERTEGLSRCTVTGALSDAAEPSRPLRPGKLILRRTPEVRDAGSEQLRWIIRSSTFLEPMDRSGTGEPA